MKFVRVCSAAVVLSCAGLEGCGFFHHFRSSQQPQALAPTVPTQNAQTELPLPPPPAPAIVTLAPSTPSPAPETQPTLQHKRKKTHYRRHPSKQGKKIVADNAAAKPTPDNTTQTASNTMPAAPPALSPWGQLSADDSSSNPALGQQTINLIAATEKRLKSVSPDQAATNREKLLQIRSFLTQAKQALAIHDLQGANTLATKAKILVDELSK